MPHQILHPQPTKQNSTVNNWAAATIKLTQNEPNRDWKLSFTVNLGLPKHKHNMPLENVPINKNKNIITNIMSFYRKNHKN